MNGCKPSTGDTISVVLCPVMGSPVQEGQGHTGANTVKGYEGGEGTGSSVIWEEADRAGTVQPRD